MLIRLTTSRTHFDRGFQVRTICRTMTVLTTTAMILLQTVSSESVFGCVCDTGDANQKTTSNTACCCSSRNQSGLELPRHATVPPATCCHQASTRTSPEGESASCRCRMSHRQPALPPQEARLTQIENLQWTSLAGVWPNSPFLSASAHLLGELPPSLASNTAFAQKVYCIWLT